MFPPILACSLARVVTLGSPPSLNHSELSIVFATPDHIPALLKLAPKCPVLKMIVSMEPLSEQTRKVLAAWGETLNIQIKEMSERAYGRKYRVSGTGR